jgi:hypothetical protein
MSTAKKVKNIQHLLFHLRNINIYIRTFTFSFCYISGVGVGGEEEWWRLQVFMASNTKTVALQVVALCNQQKLTVISEVLPASIIRKMTHSLANVGSKHL